MSDAAQQSSAPILKSALILWSLALMGALLILPYVTTLEHTALTAAAQRTHFTVIAVVAVSMVQTAILLAIAILVGLWAARKLSLGTPLIAAFLDRRAAPRGARTSLMIALALGVLTGLFLIALDRWVFSPIPSVAALIHGAQSGSAAPARWQGFLASFYGALDEEVLLRLGVMSLLALIFRTFARMLSANRESLPAGVFWLANLVAALLFGLGHLPATAALAPLTAALVIRAVVLNGTAGLVFGALFRRYGLEWAMVSHFGTDIVLHVLA